MGHFHVLISWMLSWGIYPYVHQVSTSGPVCVRFEARKTSEVRNVKPVSVRLHSLTGRPKRMFELTALLVRDMGVGVTGGGEGGGEGRGERRGGEGGEGGEGEGGEGGVTRGEEGRGDRGRGVEGGEGGEVIGGRGGGRQGGREAGRG